MQNQRKDKLARLNQENLEIDINHSLYLHYKSFHKVLFNAFNDFASGTLLDIGCGNKPYIEFLSKKVTTYVGCDIIQSDSENVDVICPANNIPLQDNSFDTVISTQTIEHVEDHFGLITEAYRLLVPGGNFIISGPMYWPLHEEPYDFFRFTKHGFKFLLEKAGFEIVEIKSNGGKWAVAGQALIHAIYPTIFNIKGKKGVVIKFIAKTFKMVQNINRLFSYIDSKVYDDTNTMNYVVIARKPKI